MRKTSQDGDTTSAATSGFENENKKPKTSLYKSKIIMKRTPPNLSEESDEAVIEPLLLDAMEKQMLTAKHLEKQRPDTLLEISKRLHEKRSQSAVVTGTNETLLTGKDQATSKSNQSDSNSNAPMHNYMNTNVFHTHGSSIASNTTKGQLLIEIGGCKQNGNNTSSLIFTTAKIHTDGKNMEPVHITPAPILSTVEVNVSKDGNIATTKENKVSNVTSDINTLYSQPPGNDKAKDNAVNISTSNDDILIKTTANSKRTITKAKSPLDIKDSMEKSSRSNITTSVVQKKGVKAKANPSKPSIQSSLLSEAMEIHSLSEISRAVNVKDDLTLAKDTKDDKKLVDEPRIVMSETKVKLPVSEKVITSLNTKKSPTEVSESPAKQPQINQSSDKDKSAKNDLNFDSDPNIKKADVINTERNQNKNTKIPFNPKDLAGKSDINATKFTNLSKNVKPDHASKLELKKIASSPQNSQPTTEPSAKAFSSSTKTTTQSNDSKNMNKPPSANESTKSTSKITLNSTDMLATNKSPTPGSIVKPAHCVNSLSSATTDTSNQTLSSSSIGNLKAIISTVPTSANITMSSSAIKTQSTSTKTATSTGNTKGTSATSTKSSKPSSASSAKSPNSSITTTKQPGASTSKTASGKRPPLAFTKTPPVNISSPTATTIPPPSKPTVSKSASTPAGHKGQSAAPSSTHTSDASNKTKAPESDKKGGSKLSDQAKVSKG